jgi:hypothetical protein
MSQRRPILPQAKTDPVKSLKTQLLYPMELQLRMRSSETSLRRKSEVRNDDRFNVAMPMRNYD